MAPEFDEEEVEHWLLHNEIISPQQVIWTYVVEDPDTHKITDFTSFFASNPRSSEVRSTAVYVLRTCFIMHLKRPLRTRVRA